MSWSYPCMCSFVCLLGKREEFLCDAFYFLKDVNGKVCHKWGHEKVKVCRECKGIEIVDTKSEIDE